MQFPDIVRWTLIQLVKLYRLLLSPLLPPGTCRFEPSCSAYAIEALRIHGVVTGLILIIRRIFRCQPFCKSGFDPVPAEDMKLTDLIFRSNHIFNDRSKLGNSALTND